MQTEYTKVKVHNEIEFCETSDKETKQQIEKILLQNRISYYIKWYKQGLFRCKRNVSVFCINDNSRENAEELLRTHIEDVDKYVRFLMRRTTESFF